MMPPSIWPCTIFSSIGVPISYRPNAFGFDFTLPDRLLRPHWLPRNIRGKHSLANFSLSRRQVFRINVILHHFECFLRPTLFHFYGAFLQQASDNHDRPRSDSRAGIGAIRGVRLSQFGLRNRDIQAFSDDFAQGGQSPLADFSARYKNPHRSVRIFFSFTRDFSSSASPDPVKPQPWKKNEQTLIPFQKLLLELNALFFS